MVKVKKTCIYLIILLGVLFPNRISYISLEVRESFQKESSLITLSVIATCYYPTVAQCDSDPYTTASGAKINKHNPELHRWVAISRDLRKSLDFGDIILVTGAGVYDGYWTVNDVTNKKHTNSIDFLVNENSYIDKWEDVKIIF